MLTLEEMELKAKLGAFSIYDIEIFVNVMRFI
jgi:hypothetical protein